MRIRTALVVAALAVAAAAQAVVAPEDAQARYDQALAAYEAQRYDEAEASLRQLVADGAHHPDVLLALGNVSYRLDRPVEATYAYEWARRLAPSDADLRANLELARARLVADVPPDAGSPQARFLREQLERVPARWTLLGFAALWTLGWLLLGARQLGRLDGSTWLAVALLVLSLPLLAHGAFVTYRKAGVVEGIVQAPELPVRSGPGEEYATLFELHAGALVECRAERPGWRRIAFAGGPEGWAPSSDIAILGDISTLR